MLPARCRRRTLSPVRFAAPPAPCHGIFAVDAPSSQWAVTPETGALHYTARIAFDEPFPYPPKVVAGLSAMELSEGPPSRLEVRVVPGSVTTTGFTIRFATATGGMVQSAAAFWLALPS